MKNTMVQFTIMGLIELLKNLKKMVLPSSTELTQEKESDLEVTPRFKVTYPENWEKRKTMNAQEKTEYFNNWASKL